MAHKLYWIYGFEDGDGPARVRTSGGTAPSYSTAIHKNSKVAAYWDGSAGLVNGYLEPGVILADGSWNFSGLDYEWLTFHMYIDSLPTAGQYFYIYIRYRNVGATYNILVLNENGLLGVYNDNGATTEWSASGLYPGRWYCISFQMYKSGPLKAIARDMGGDTVTSVTHSLNTTGTAVLASRFGPVANSRGKVYFDNLVWEMDAASANIDDPFNLLGADYAVGQLAPIGVGNYNDYTGTFADVDEYPNDGDTTYRAETTGGLTRFTQTLAQETSLWRRVGTISAVQHFIRERNLGGTCNTRQLIRSGGSDSINTALNVGTSYIPRHYLLTLDPATAAAWTISALNAVEVGSYREISTFAARVTNVGLDVLYTCRPVGQSICFL